MYLPDHEVTLEPLTAAHADAVLAFELENREYFAAWVWDRGDDFTSFEAIDAARLAEQEAGVCQFHVLVEVRGGGCGRQGEPGRLENGSAELRYRIAAKAGGKGLATAAVRVVIQLAASWYRLTRLWAGASDRNPASPAILTRAGFRPIGKSNTDLGPGDEVRVMLEEA